MHLLSNKTEVLAVVDFDINPTNKEVGRHAERWHQQPDLPIDCLAVFNHSGAVTNTAPDQMSSSCW
jgi:hypothetical protein